MVKAYRIRSSEHLRWACDVYGKGVPSFREGETWMVVSLENPDEFPVAPNARHPEVIYAPNARKAIASYRHVNGP